MVASWRVLRVRWKKHKWVGDWIVDWLVASALWMPGQTDTHSNRHTHKGTDRHIYWSIAAYILVQMRRSRFYCSLRNLYTYSLLFIVLRCVFVGSYYSWMARSKSPQIHTLKRWITSCTCINFSNYNNKKLSTNGIRNHCQRPNVCLQQKQHTIWTHENSTYVPIRNQCYLCILRR